MTRSDFSGGLRQNSQCESIEENSFKRSLRVDQPMRQLAYFGQPEQTCWPQQITRFQNTGRAAQLRVTLLYVSSAWSGSKYSSGAFHTSSPGWGWPSTSRGD